VVRFLGCVIADMNMMFVNGLVAAIRYTLSTTKGHKVAHGEHINFACVMFFETKVTIITQSRRNDVRDSYRLS
jgi:hypothetical protein